MLSAERSKYEAWEKKRIRNHHIQKRFDIKVNIPSGWSKETVS